MQSNQPTNKKMNIFRKVPIAEFFVRYWVLTLFVILFLISRLLNLGPVVIPPARILMLYLVTLIGFVFGKKVVKKSASYRRVERALLVVIIVFILALAVQLIPKTIIPFASIFSCIAIGIVMATLRYPHPGFSKEHPLIINGRLYAQHVTGVQRYGIEIIKQIDKMVEPGEVILALPHGELQTRPELHNIELAYIGKGNGNKWTQFHLPIFAIKKRGTILTLAAIAPAVKPDYVVTHDISFMRYPESYGRSFRMMYAIGYLLTLYRCKGIITISEFSKNELIDFYGIDEDRFTIAGNSAEQLLESTYKEQSLGKWGIGEGEKYYLSVGSKNLHKNQIFIKKLAQKYPDRKFVVAGGSSERSFGTSGNLSSDSGKTPVAEQAKDKAICQNTAEGIPSNLTITGYITDDELRTLYSHALGFIFPSLYEGFGIPPLEAILMGVKHIAVADIPVLREVYPRGCYFFDPENESTFDIDELDNGEIITDEIREFYINMHSWKKSANTILEAIR